MKVTFCIFSLLHCLLWQKNGAWAARTLYGSVQLGLKMAVAHQIWAWKPCDLCISLCYIIPWHSFSFFFYQHLYGRKAEGYCCFIKGPSHLIIKNIWNEKELANEFLVVLDLAKFSSFVCYWKQEEKRQKKIECCLRCSIRVTIDNKLAMLPTNSYTSIAMWKRRTLKLIKSFVSLWFQGSNDTTA